MSLFDTRGRIVQQVASLKPGQRIEIDMAELEDIPTRRYNEAIFKPADSILEMIVGSAYSFCYHENPVQNSITFERLIQPSSLPVYVSPDHRTKEMLC